MSNIKLFESQKIRSHWDAEKEKWYFSVVDIIEVLTESPRPRKYWNALKTKLQQEGSELSHILGQLKMQSLDGKSYITDVADTEQLLRLIQSIPSPKAEPFKLWLAKVGYERIEETQDPEKSIDRAMEKQGGTIAGNTRKEIEAKTGKKIVSSQNAKQLKNSINSKKLK